MVEAAGKQTTLASWPGNPVPSVTAVEYKPAPQVTPKELIRVREDLHIARALFAAYLRTNVRRLENWEQGRAKPSAQAVLLISRVQRFTDAVERLAAI